jgi:hypothetical protein
VINPTPVLGKLGIFAIGGELFFSDHVFSFRG